MEKAAFIIYFIILALSPLLFGAVHTYAYTIMSLGVLCGSLLLVITNIRKNPKSGVYQFEWPATSLNVVFYMLLVFLIIQLIPLPESLIKILSPEAWVARQKSLPASDIMTAEAQSGIWFALSSYAYPVRMSLIRWTVYGLFFLGLCRVLNSQKRIETAIFLILIIGCFETFYGLAETYSGSPHIWWFKKPIGSRAVTGTYINSNHFAGFMEMGFLLAAAYAAGLSERKKRRKNLSSQNRKLRAWLALFLSKEQTFSKRTFVLFAGVTMGIGIVLSGSRGGLISVAAAMLFMSLLFIYRKSLRRKGFVIFFLFLITSVYALHIGVEYTVGKFETIDKSYEVRSRFTKKTLELFTDYKLVGIGLGNFRYAYPRYQAPEDKKSFIRHAHNDWAQFLAEAGVIGLCLLLAGIIYYLYRTMTVWKRRKDFFATCLGVAPIAVITAMAIHANTDFNLHIPANFLIFTAVLAIGYSALHLQRRHRKKNALNRNHSRPLRYKGLLVLVLILGIIVWNGTWTIRHFMAEAYCNSVHNPTLNRDQNPPPEEIEKAIAWDKWNGVYWYKLAQELIKIRNVDFETQFNEERDQRQMEIIRVLEQAVRLNPFQALYHLRLGWEYTYLWQQPTYHQKWLPAANIAMDRAAYYAGVKTPYFHMELGNYWVMRSKSIWPTDPEKESAWTKACWHYKKAQEIDGSKEMLKRIIRYIWNFYPDWEIVLEAIHVGYMDQVARMFST